MGDNASRVSAQPHPTSFPYPADTRPPVVQLVAISAIAVAVLSIIASLFTAGYAASLYVAAARARDAILRNAPLAMPMSRPDQPVTATIALLTPVGRRGLDSSQRQTVFAALQQRISILPNQSRQLDALLAEDGAEMFGVSADRPISPEGALDAVGDSFGLLAGKADDAAQPFYFTTSAGRAEIFNDRALFYRNKSLAPVRATAGRRLNASGHPILLPPDVSALTDLVQQSSGGALNAAQLLAVQSLLANPQQQLIALSGGAGEFAGIQGASVMPGGFARIDFAGGPLLMTPQGTVLLRTDEEAIPAVSGVASAMAAAEGMASIALAILLAAIGARLLGGWRPSRAALASVAVAKLVLAIIAGLAIGWVTSNHISSRVQLGLPSPAPQGAAVAAGIALTLLGSAYPLLLLVTIGREDVRVYLRRE